MNRESDRVRQRRERPLDQLHGSAKAPEARALTAPRVP